MIAYLVAVLVTIVVISLLVVGHTFVQRVIEKAVWPRGITRLDDRGNEVTVSEPRQLPKEQFPHLCYRRFFTRWALDHRPRLGPAFFISMGGAGIAPFPFLALWYFGISVPPTVSWAITIALFAFGVLAMRYWRQCLLRWQSDAVVSFGHCASCGYGLRELERDPDRFVACSECGAAWKPRWLDVA